MYESTDPFAHDVTDEPAAEHTAVCSCPDCDPSFEDEGERLAGERDF